MYNILNVINYSNFKIDNYNIEFIIYFIVELRNINNALNIFENISNEEAIELYIIKHNDIKYNFYWKHQIINSAPIAWSKYTIQTLINDTLKGIGYGSCYWIRYEKLSFIIAVNI